MTQLRIENWVQSPYAATLGRTLLHSLWEGAAVALGLAAVLCVVRSSRARYAAASIAMVVMLGGLVVTFARLAPEEPIKIPLTRMGVSSPIPAGPIALPSPSPREPRPMDQLAWLAPLWIAGVLIFHLRGMASWIAARRLRRTGVCCAADLWQSRLDRLKIRLRMDRSVALLESCLAEVPVVIGYVRPIILMPVGLMAGLPVEQVEAILLHELAHIRRYDYLVNLLQVFVEGLLFYHPAVWWISGVMRTERENCCDDLVVSVTGGAYEYASALTALENARWRVDSGTAMAATGGNLVNRIQRLLGRPQRRYVAAMPVFTAAILTVTVVTALAALQLGSGVQVDATAIPTAPLAKAEQAPQVAPTAKEQPGDDPAFQLLYDLYRHTQGLARRTTAPQNQMAQLAPASQNQPKSTQPDKVLFDRAISDIEHGNYQAARLTLNTLINTYDTSPYLVRAKLAIADSWFREGGPHGLAQAMVEYKDFVLFYPNAPEAQQAQTKLNQMLSTPYMKWMNEDVVYIISNEERKAFQSLTTDEEREQFEEQFWARRDPTPGTPRNESKDEHYRRIGYANEHFASGIPGWRTDRGRIYIQYGPPDEIEAHSFGGTYERPMSQGGGVTETFPFEQWRYKFIDGVGQNIIIEFVDTARNGEYRMTMDPNEKDQLLNLQRPPNSPPR
jgi:GWxTD domain-containing protein